MSEAYYKKKSEILFERNTILINQLGTAKGLLRAAFNRLPELTESNWTAAEVELRRRIKEFLNE